MPVSSAELSGCWMVSIPPAVSPRLATTAYFVRVTERLGQSGSIASISVGGSCTTSAAILSAAPYAATTIGPARKTMRLTKRLGFVRVCDGILALHTRRISVVVEGGRLFAHGT
eukprot:gnl/TRDRNA2_/TRDRNA2_166845_c2_seq1.p1 gnl/TRDRNA2_/TRDRNA2_166845_c2~~gnl/TRDRNA2_/TRDRNA2_166845_c2_seq1.p1  ORF type:complete len:114 (+),score=7.05 gnl/TRDRNA2_/TRDRNA2_166845_c2_seq1:182-523(+)